MWIQQWGQSQKRYKTFGRNFLTYPHTSLSMNTKETNNVTKKWLDFQGFYNFTFKIYKANQDTNVSNNIFRCVCTIPTHNITLN